MARLFNVLNFSIHRKIIFISRQNNFVCAHLKYIKSLSSPQRRSCWWNTLLGKDLAFYLHVFFFSGIVYIWRQREQIRMRGGCSQQYMRPNIKKGCWIFLIVSERKEKETDYSKVRIQSFSKFLGENTRSPVKKLRNLYRCVFIMT